MEPPAINKNVDKVISNDNSRNIKVQHNMTNRDICLYVLDIMGGRKNWISTEDIAIKAFEIYPERFALIKYPQYPDVDSVRVTLVDLRKSKYHSLVGGNKKGGWKITMNGEKWLNENSIRIKTAIQKKHPREKRISSGKMITRSKLAVFYKQRILDTIAYVKWKEGEQINLYEFLEVMRIDQYTPENIYRKRLEDMILALDEFPDLIKFLKELNDRFGQTYRGEGGL